MTPDYAPDLTTLTTLRGHPPVCAWSLGLRGWHLTLDYVSTTLLADATPDEVQAVVHDPGVRQTHDHAWAVAQQGEEALTRTACQAWIRACRRVLSAHRRLQQEVAA